MKRLPSIESIRNDDLNVGTMHREIPYLFEYNAQNFVRNFNQKIRVRVIHECFHQHALFLFLFLDTDIHVTQEEFEQLFGESDDESGFKL